MFIRKINAVLSLFTTILILDHSIFLGIWMLSRGTIPKSENYLPWTLTGITLVHALISMGLMIYRHREKRFRKDRKYPKMNVQTVVQRVTGILMVIFTGLHIAGTIGYIHPPKLIHAINPPLFFAVVLAHVSVSTSKAFITLGLGNAKFIKAVDIIIKLICAVTLVADIVGFYIHLY